ncbi:MAG: GGDEF domain-containing protein [Lachnospiraceae bacterium]|nr:GGDEF domain-containing protein [Lachnospiraceae bacterium]
MNQYFNVKVARESAKIVNVTFLLIHVVLFFYFRALGVTPMCCLNIISIFLYIVGYFWLNGGKLNVFIYLSGFEILVHTVSATICVGLACGMQWILLFMPIEFFYTEFFSLQIRDQKAWATISSVVNLIFFLFLDVYMRSHEPLYAVPGDVAFVTRLLLIVLIFSLSMFLLHTLTKYAYLTEKKMREKSAVDGLTGFYNRFELMDELDARLQRKTLSGAWAAMIDLDNFTQVNEKYGRNIGDQVLMRVSDVLRVQSLDVLCARWGGDKFLICGFECRDEQEVLDAMNKLRERLDAISFDMIEGEIRVQATIGISFYRENDSVRQWLSTADKKLYAGKYNGKNCVVN